MKCNRYRLAVALAGVTIAGLQIRTAAAPLGTVFTYQGQLKDGGSAPTGTYDLQFRLFDAAATPPGVQVGATIQLDNVSVTNGLFTVTLDFGAQFTGDARWLDIGVHPGAQPVGNPYTVLSPRQQLTGSPYALGVRLPLSETILTSSPAISITNTGTGRAAAFESDNPASNASTVRVDTNSTNTGVAAVAGVNSGSGRAGHFEINNAGNSQPAILAITNGTGPGMRIQKAADTLEISQNSLDTAGDGFFGDPLYLNLNSPEPILIGFGGGNCGIGGGASGFPLVPLHVDGGVDASLTNLTGGYFLIGASNTTNIVMDDNEIMARNDSAASTLFLNHNGGNVNIGQGSGGTSRLVTPVLQITGGSDLSENFEVTSQAGASAEPGTVLCIDPRNPGKLMPCTRAYDRTVAGVISGAGGVKTGMLMGQEGTIADGSHPVALTGRVYVRCDARASAIETGDLLTTSDAAGHAMKAMDRERSHGAVLGKAMTALERGKTGLVLVLVNLQ